MLGTGGSEMMETDCGGQVVGDRSQGANVGREEGFFKKTDEEAMEDGNRG